MPASHGSIGPVGVEFHYPVYRTAHRGDNWCQTWAGDGHIYTSLDDGTGWAPLPNGQEFNTRVFRIKGGPEPIEGELLDNFPVHMMRGGWYGYGILGVNGTLYHFITCASKDRFAFPFQGAKLIYSSDYGSSWFRHDGADARVDPLSTDPAHMFYWHETDDYAFANLEFLQAGRDYRDARDGYAYLYAPGGRHEPWKLNMARVPVDRILNRASYEFFARLDDAGRPVWTADVARRGVVRAFPARNAAGEEFGWYSYLPSVVYNKALGLYVMATGATGGEEQRKYMHTPPGSLMLLWAHQPWGPWHEFYYTENWTAGEDTCRLYQPKLSPRFISADGKEMVLVFSDAQAHEGRTHNKHYRWNQQKITLRF
ncbi:MAG: hypothetical protein WD042_06765 [Phycisphaeraceae bacterium]